MSDESIQAALRSDAALVVVEAPAGCGKTHQGAEYAKDVSLTQRTGRLLILTHTHAACSMFSDRTRGTTSSSIEIRTLDSVISSIATAYHSGLGLPDDIMSWIRQRQDGYRELAVKVASLVKRYPMIADSLSHRYPFVICDEHQDSSGDQHALVMALLNQGSKVRIFADPMQKIFTDEVFKESNPPCDWSDLKRRAQASEQLDTPHRWASGCPNLGQWTLRAREILKSGGSLDLRDRLPSSVGVVFAENESQKLFDYRLSNKEREPIDAFERSQSSLLILTHYRDTAKFLRAFFNRQIPLWEGHTRSALETLVELLSTRRGDRQALAAAVVKFMSDVGKGFSPSEFGDRFQREVSEGCVRITRGKPAKIQELARYLVSETDHHGVAKVLRRISELKDVDSNFASIEIDCHKEFWEAIRLADFDTANDGLAEITHRRHFSRPKPPMKAISTIHKAKGLECGSVIIMPCDGKTFPDSPQARCLLYVAISRAKRRLMLVLSRNNPSPLIMP